MTDKEEIECLEEAIRELNKFRDSLDEGNLREFEILISRILDLLNEEESNRFRRISFYSKQDDSLSLLYDDLPF